MFLLDTDLLSLHMQGNSKVVARVTTAMATDLVATSVIARIEVLQGRFDFVLKASNKAQWLYAQALLFKWESILTGYRIVAIDVAAADEFERLSKIKSLRKIGRADLLIASIALAHRATLVTRNLKDFKLVPGLKCENWAD